MRAYLALFDDSYPFGRRAATTARLPHTMTNIGHVVHTRTAADDVQRPAAQLDADVSVAQARRLLGVRTAHSGLQGLELTTDTATA